MGYILGGGLYIGCLHVRSAWNRADAPSRGRPVEAASREIRPWFLDLESGDHRRFDQVIASAKWVNPLGRWVRILLLLAGDIERNPGPESMGPRKYQPRGPLDLNVGFSQATAARMEMCLKDFSNWLGLDLDDALASAEVANLALRAYGMELFAGGFPRYKFVYAVTGVQHLRPEFRMQLAGAWQVDKCWQIHEPGQCRAVLSVPMLRAAISLSLLWGWCTFAALVAIGFAGMLHPNEFIHLTRRDLIFPKDAMSSDPVLYIFIKNPKTARFARRQHTKIVMSVFWFWPSAFLEPFLLISRCLGHLWQFSGASGMQFSIICRFPDVSWRKAPLQAPFEALAQQLCIWIRRISPRSHGVADVQRIRLWSIIFKKLAPSYFCTVFPKRQKNGFFSWNSTAIWLCIPCFPMLFLLRSSILRVDRVSGISI